MNMHAIQTYMAKAEGQLCVSDNFYESPTDGKPMREIMQDGIIGAVYISMKDCFFSKSQFMELIYQATFSLFAGAASNSSSKNRRLFLVQPAIEKPKTLWTGKQLITNVIKLVVHYSNLPYSSTKGLSLTSASKTPKKYLTCPEESTIVFMNNQLLQGIIDKSQIGSKSEYGFVHSFMELYG